MAELAKLKLTKFRSIENVTIEFPEKIPTILFGQNNAGKSNILKALNIIMGEQYPKTIQIEDSDYYLRKHENKIEISAYFRSLLGGAYKELRWSHEYDRQPEPTSFVGILEDGREKWPKNDQREDCVVVVIEAERNLNYQLSYSSKYTMLNKLMHRFHQVLSGYDEIKEELKRNFSETKKVFNQVPEFQKFCNALKEDFSSSMKCWSYKLEIDFEAYNPLNFFHALRVQASEKEHTRAFEELGTGEQQILAISFAHAYARAFKSGFILVIEEPEAHLHPLAQAWLADRTRKMCEDGLQIVLSTHSPSFLDIMSVPGMHLVYRDEDTTAVRRHDRKTLAAYCISRGALKGKCTDETILPFYSANTNEELLKGFFAKAVVLVEGPTEALALPIYLSALDCDTREKGIAVIPVHGKGSIARYIRLYEAYGIPAYAIFDNDPQDDTSGNKRKEIVETCGHPFDEKILKEEDIYVAGQFSVFGKDFEGTLRKKFSNFGYSEKESLIIDKFGPAKPLVAREVASLLIEEGVEDGVWDRLKEIALKVSALVDEKSKKKIPS